MQVLDNHLIFLAVHGGRFTRWNRSTSCLELITDLTADVIGMQAISSHCALDNGQRPLFGNFYCGLHLRYGKTPAIKSLSNNMLAK